MYVLYRCIEAIYDTLLFFVNARCSDSCRPNHCRRKEMCSVWSTYLCVVCQCINLAGLHRIAPFTGDITQCGIKCFGQVYQGLVQCLASRNEVLSKQVYVVQAAVDCRDTWEEINPLQCAAWILTSDSDVKSQSPHINVLTRKLN